jgi:hypothetical protein
VKPSTEQSLTALLTAGRDRDAGSVASIWRELAPVEQENILFTLLGMQSGVASEGVAVVPDEIPDAPERRTAETEALAVVVEQTELIPNLVDDLRGLTGTANDQLNDPQGGRAAPTQVTDYRSRWLQRWKWSVLVAAWAVTTFFAFTAETSTFGPMGWVVALFGTVVLGGLFVGTLVNFVVAVIPARTQGRPRPTEPPEGKATLAQEEARPEWAHGENCTCARCLAKTGAGR